MATPKKPSDYKQVATRRGRRNRGAMAAMPAPDGWQSYVAPEMRYLAARGPQLAALAAGVKQLRALVNAEKNFFDVSGSQVFGVTPGAINLSNVPMGDDVQMRSGRSIKLKGFSLSLHLQSAIAATGITMARVLVVKDMFYQGADPTLAQILANVTAGVNVESPLNLSSQQGRFSIVVNDVVALTPLSGGQPAVTRSYSADLQHHVEFIGTSGADGDLGAGQLLLYVMADQIATNAVSFSYYSRIRYYDN